MPRPKKKYSNPAPTPTPITPVASGTPAYSFDLKAAATYSGFSIWALRQAIYAKQLPVVNQKPYIIRRADLEAYVDGRVQVAA
jgi:hypothetical protein